MKVRLKKSYKTKGHIDFIPQNKLIELYESFSVIGTTWYNTNLGFRIRCDNFDDLFVKIGDQTYGKISRVV